MDTQDQAGGFVLWLAESVSSTLGVTALVSARLWLESLELWFKGLEVLGGLDVLVHVQYNGAPDSTKNCQWSLSDFHARTLM